MGLKNVFEFFENNELTKRARIVGIALLIVITFFILIQIALSLDFYFEIREQKRVTERYIEYSFNEYKEQYVESSLNFVVSPNKKKIIAKSESYDIAIILPTRRSYRRAVEFAVSRHQLYDIPVR